MKPKRVVCCLVPFVSLVASAPAADGVWTGGVGSWTNTANWLDGYVPQAGDTAAFVGAGGDITVPVDAPFILSALYAHTNGANAYVTLKSSATNTLAAPAAVRVEPVELTLAFPLAGVDGLAKTGLGALNLDHTTNLFTGPVTVTGGGVLRVRTDGALGPVPPAPDPDAITLDDGGLGAWGVALTLAPTRGITAGPGGAWFLARGSFDIAVNAPITGPGSVGIAKQTAAVTFFNPDNDYAGDTILGSENRDWSNSEAARGRLILGADEVIPDGAGKGILRFIGDKKGVLDLNGHSETVNSIAATNGLVLLNSGTGFQNPVLQAGSDNADMRLSGEIGGGATLEKTGAGTLNFFAGAGSTGTLHLAQGTLVFPSGESLGGLTLLMDGGSLQAADSFPGLTERRGAASSWNVNQTLAFNNILPGTEKGYRGNTDFGSNTQVGYFGQWHVPEAGTYSFAKSFDDAASLRLDGVLLLNNASSSGLAVTQHVAVAAGWHDLEIRFFNGTGAVGPYGGHSFPSGIVFDPADSALDTPELQAAAFRFEDGAAGTSLRTAPLGSAENAVSARMELAQDAALDLSGAPASPLAWGGDLVATVPGAKLTVSGGTAPFRFGGTARPAVFDADIACVDGVTFQNTAWLKSWPASSAYTVAAGTELAAGVPGILGSGDIDLAAQTYAKLRIPGADTGIGAVAVPAGKVVRFDATREEGGRLHDDTAYAFTADNDVTLGGGSAAIAFDGAGTITYTGSLTGSGRLVKNGVDGTAVLTQPSTFEGSVQISQGKVLLGDPAALGAATNRVTFDGGVLGSADGAALTLPYPVTVNATGGALEIPAAGWTLTGALSGTLVKRGPGDLTLGGADANASLDLAVDEGTVLLAKNGAVRHIVRIASNAVARLAAAGGDLVTGNLTMQGGTFDLNGRSEAVGGLNSDIWGSTVVNNGAAPAVLSAVSGAFRGTLQDGAAALGLDKTGTGELWLYGDPQPVAYTGPTTVSAGTLNWGIPVTFVRMTVTKTRSGTAGTGISEFRVLRGGEWLPLPAGTVATASSQNGPTGGPERLIDFDASTKWRALSSATGNPWIRLEFPSAVAIDGYAWYTCDDGSDRDPVSWTLEISRNGTSWHLADVQADAAVTGSRRMLAGAWTFRDPYVGNCTVSAGSAVEVAAGAAAVVNVPRGAVAALAGAGTVALVDGVELAVVDASAFAGKFTGGGTVSSAGEITAGDAASGVTLAGPVVLSNGAFRASVRDDAAPASLAKRGPGTALLYGSASAYTGPTAIEGGTLAIPPPAAAWRYVRFHVTEVRDPAHSGGGNRVSLGEFQLTLGGAAVALPPGTVASASSVHSAPFDASHAIDGNWTNNTGRFISGSGSPQWLKLDMQEPVAFDGYQWYTAADPGYDPYRDPVTWTFEGSRDGVVWTVLDSHVKEVYPTTRMARVGPFAVAAAPAPLPPALWGTVEGDRVAAVSARYLRFTPMRTRQATGVFFQFGELELRLDGATVPWPAGTVVSTPGPNYTDATQILTPDKAVDNILPTAGNNNRWYSQSAVNPLTVDMGQPVTFNAYRLWTAYLAPERDPISWTLEASADGTGWCMLDTQTNQLYSTARYACAGEWALPAFDARTETRAAALPDGSPVSIAAGATLRLAGSAETVGPLTGTGTVELLDGATLGVNLFGDAAFAGSFVSEGGTLELAGSHALACVSAVSGDLAVAFRGGRFGGLLNVSGALAVTGPVAYAQPAAFPATVPLFTFGSIDAASRDALTAGAASLSVPPGMVAKVTVTAASATLTVNAPGTVIILK
jgi:autotransporter-associated beta strand protein